MWCLEKTSTSTKQVRHATLPSVFQLLVIKVEMQRDIFLHI